VIDISRNQTSGISDIIVELENMEKNICNMPLVFTEIFKDEINANDELRLYNGVKRIVKKYSSDREALAVLDEFTSVISGGASLGEILKVVRDEAVNPTLETGLTVDRECDLH